MQEDYKIKFKGELSEESQKLLLRKIYNRHRLILLFSGLIVALLGFIVYKFLNKIIGQYFIVCGVAGCLVIVLSIRLIWRKKEAKSEMPKQIVIADNKIKIYFENNTFGERDLGIPFVITNYRKGDFLALSRDRSIAVRRVRLPRAREKSSKNARFSVRSIFAVKKSPSCGTVFARQTTEIVLDVR